MTKLNMRLRVCDLLRALVLTFVAGGAIAQHADHDDGAETSDVEQLTLDTAPVQEVVALSCAFATECYEAEACQESGFGVILSGKAGGMDAQTLFVDAAMSSDSGDVGMVGARDGGNYVLSGGGFEGRHMLTIAQGGAARYTVHYTDPVMMISYSGQCLETE